MNITQEALTTLTSELQAELASRQEDETSAEGSPSNWINEEMIREELKQAIFWLRVVQCRVDGKNPRTELFGSSKN